MMTDYCFKTEKGLNKNIVEQISAQKNEPSWMTSFRVQALEKFESMPLPSWGPDLSQLNMHDLHYYIKPLESQKSSWSDVPDKIKDTFLKLGIPQAEHKMLAGVGAQFESEVIYKNLKREWADKGVLFCDMSTALAHYPELFKQYFATVVPPDDNPFAALNSAVWSGEALSMCPKGFRSIYRSRHIFELMRLAWANLSEHS